MPEDNARSSGAHPGAHPDEHLYGTQEAAEFLGIHRSTLHLAVARNVLIPDGHTPGGHLRFRRQTLEHFADRLHCEPATNRSSSLTELVATLALREGDIAFCHRAFARIRQAIPAFTMYAVAWSAPTPSDPHAIEPLIQEGFPPHLMPQYQKMRPNLEFATTTALRTMEPELCEDIAKKHPLRMGTSSLLRRRELRSFAIVPIVIQESPLGVLVVASAKPHRIPPPEVSFLQSIAADLGVALSCHAHLNDLRSSLAVAADLALRAAQLQAEVTSLPYVQWERMITGIDELCDLLCGGSGAEEVVVLGETLRHVRTPAKHQCSSDDTAAPVATGSMPSTYDTAAGAGKSPQLDELVARVRTQGDSESERETWSEVDGTHCALALNLPAGRLERVTVGAAWHGERREPEADEALLLAFASACTLLLGAVAPQDRSQSHGGHGGHSIGDGVASPIASRGETAS